jgi:hypothetical protein
VALVLLWAAMAIAVVSAVDYFVRAARQDIHAR